MMHTHHHVLGHVLGVGRELLAENRHCQPEHGSPISPDELGERRFVGRPLTLRDEPFVRLLGV